MVCVCNIWTDVKLLLWQGGSARLTDTAQRRHCQLVVIWSLINSTYLQMIFFDRYRTGLSREPLNGFFRFLHGFRNLFLRTWRYSMYLFYVFISSTWQGAKPRTLNVNMVLESLTRIGFTVIHGIDITYSTILFNCTLSDSVPDGSL